MDYIAFEREELSSEILNTVNIVEISLFVSVIDNYIVNVLV